MDMNFVARQLVEKAQEHKDTLYMLFQGRRKLLECGSECGVCVCLCV